MTLKCIQCGVVMVGVRSDRKYCDICVQIKKRDRGRLKSDTIFKENSVMLKVCKECKDRFETNIEGKQFCESCAKKRRKEMHRLNSRLCYRRLSKEKKAHRKKVSDIRIRAHADEVKQYKMEYRKNNSNRLRQYSSIYRQNNIDKIRKYGKEYCNKAEVRLKRTKYHRDNIVKIGGSRYNINTCSEEIKPWVRLAIYLRTIRISGYLGRMS
jgi:hypothetical protein